MKPAHYHNFNELFYGWKEIKIWEEKTKIKTVRRQRVLAIPNRSPLSPVRSEKRTKNANETKMQNVNVLHCTVQRQNCVAVLCFCPQNAELFSRNDGMERDASQQKRKNKTNVSVDFWNGASMTVCVGKRVWNEVMGKWGLRGDSHVCVVLFGASLLIRGITPFRTQIHQ